MSDKVANDLPALGSGPLKVAPLLLQPDPGRTVLRPFDFAYPEDFAEDLDSRSLAVARRVLSLDQPQLAQALKLMLEPMRARHRNAEAVLLRRYGELGEKVRQLRPDDTQKLLLGAYFSQEYAFESAALFNPSILGDPNADEDGGGTRFVLSLRGIGEGHISSVTFRTGMWSVDGEVTVDAPSAQAVPPRIVHEGEDIGTELICVDSADVSETVIFPVLPSQNKGIEDLRLVRFIEEDGRQQIIGTYTAFDGRSVRQELLRAIDFRTIWMRPLRGRMSAHKGMALFPRRIDGRYVMLG
ncbi:MAG TPA: glycosidase, partial [Candidatus Dormibacteraeota bacterium]